MYYEWNKKAKGQAGRFQGRASGRFMNCLYKVDINICTIKMQLTAIQLNQGTCQRQQIVGILI